MNNRIHDFAALPSTRTLVLDLKGVRSKKALLALAAEALKLPPHFGHNWDALADCLMDPQWAKAAGYTLVVLDSAGARKRLGEHWDVLQEILTDTADWWQQQGKLFNVILA